MNSGRSKAAITWGVTGRGDEAVEVYCVLWSDAPHPAPREMPDNLVWPLLWRGASSATPACTPPR
ncbi:hypothetical protein E2C01_095448 [Portunus trituberculatus]|uniref:Uncharacterized protein n=1 Tax=Portunus trituberculatus TaxID=210409 RepID=A0A5B7JPV2_PORTR|nr:hypothetical protein [Portunus trituberculatus]